MNGALLGKILATILTGAIDAGAILVNPKGELTNPEHLKTIVGGFLEIWVNHPASLIGAESPLGAQIITEQVTNVRR